MIVLVLFCCTVGYGLSTTHVTVWGLLTFPAAAVIALEASYLVGRLIHW
jgi:hypothetical protein